MSIKYKNLEKKKFDVGEAIFNEGDVADCAYLIETGEVQIYNSDMEEIAVLSQGDILGEMAVIRNRARSFSAFASENVCLVIIERDVLMGKLDEADPLISLIIISLIDKLYDFSESGDIGVKHDSLDDMT